MRLVRPVDKPLSARVLSCNRMLTKRDQNCLVHQSLEIKFALHDIAITSWETILHMLGYSVHSMDINQ